MLLNLKKSESGQTSVEYILMMVVVVGILFSVMGQVKHLLIADAGNCHEGSKSIVCGLDRALSFGNYKRFRIFK